MLHYDDSKEKPYIVYLNFNDQYGWVLSEPTSCTGFECVKDISISTPNFIINYGRKSNFVYTLVVDVYYPEYLLQIDKDS